MAVGAKPGDRVGETLMIGPRNVAQLAPRLGIVEEHMMTRHPQAIHRDKGFDAAKRRQQLRSICDWIKHFPRQLELGRSSPNEASDVGKHIGEKDVVAAKDITLSYSPAVERGNVTGGDVVDMR